MQLSSEPRLPVPRRIIRKTRRPTHVSHVSQQSQISETISESVPPTPQTTPTTSETETPTSEDVTTEDPPQQSTMAYVVGILSGAAVAGAALLFL